MQLKTSLKTSSFITDVLLPMVAHGLVIALFLLMIVVMISLVGGA